MLQSRQAETAVIVTVWNPFSTPLADEVNRLRNVALEHHLADNGLPCLPAEGRDPTGQWAAEHSFLAFDPSPGQVETLLVDFQQHAVVVVSHEAVSLVRHRAHRR
jgi:hypothetical protein